MRRDARDDEDIESPSIIPFEVLENPQNSDRVQVNHEVELLRVQLDNAREVIGREREFSALLKSQLEAVTQSEAQTKAALREALKFQAKQLGPAPTDATTPPDRAPIGQAENLAPKHTEAARSPQTDTGAAPKKELRPLWKVILGVR